MIEPLGHRGRARRPLYPSRSCPGDLVGLLAQTDRRAAYAGLALGATSLAEVAELAKLRPPAAAAALQKLTDGRIAAFDSEKRTYTLLDDTFRLAVQAEVPNKSGGLDLVRGRCRARGRRVAGRGQPRNRTR
uniref:hypothetical protein n=1 Tax=Streptomyces sp. NBC_01562 TaxID=2975879 RepID=UPI002F90A21D